VVGICGRERNYDKFGLFLNVYPLKVTVSLDIDNFIKTIITIITN